MMDFNRNDCEANTLPVHTGIGHRMGWLSPAKDVGEEKVQTRKLGVGPGHIGTHILRQERLSTEPLQVWLLEYLLEMS